jgi:hypothetical protein
MIFLKCYSGYISNEEILLNILVMFCEKSEIITRKILDYNIGFIIKTLLDEKIEVRREINGDIFSLLFHYKNINLEITRNIFNQDFDIKKNNNLRSYYVIKR